VEHGDSFCNHYSHKIFSELVRWDSHYFPFFDGNGLSINHKSFENFIHTTLPVSRTSFVHPLSKFDIQVIISERSRCGPQLLTNWLLGGAEAHSVPLA
jgi:hypothetical protein